MADTTPVTPGATVLQGRTQSTLVDPWTRALLLMGLCLVAIVASQCWISNRQIAWIACTALIALTVMIIGWAAAGRPDGVIVDKRNVVSLSKLQMIVWTVFLCGAVVTEVGRRLAADASADPLLFKIPTDLLVAMGISTTSLVATPMLLSLKTPAVNGGGPPVDTVFRRPDKNQASWADLFTGDETGNADSVDLSKVQQFLITLLVVGIYAAALWNFFAGTGGAGLPDFDANLAWLLGISHAGYLSYKAAPHTSASDMKGDAAGNAAADAAGATNPTQAN